MQKDELFTLLNQKLKAFVLCKPVIIDVSRKSRLYDFIVVLSCDGCDKTREISGDLLETLGMEPNSVQGIEKGEWIVMEFEKFMIHAFERDRREKYNLEKLWKDGDNIVEIKEEKKKKVKSKTV